MDAWRSPGWILSSHAEDQGANLFAHRLPSAGLVHPRDEPPIQAKPRAMPPNHGSGVTRISGFFQPAQSLRNTIQNNLCRAMSRRRGRLVRKARSCWRRARLSRMRSSRERKALITQPMRCRSHEIMAKIVSKHPSTSRWQLVHSPSAPGFDDGQPCGSALAEWNLGQAINAVTGTRLWAFVFSLSGTVLFLDGCGHGRSAAVG
jgi:hypothetical protein